MSTVDQRIGAAVKTLRADRRHSRQLVVDHNAEDRVARVEAERIKAVRARDRALTAHQRQEQPTTKGSTPHA